MGHIAAGLMPDYNAMMGFKKIPTWASKMASRCKTRLTMFFYVDLGNDVRLQGMWQSDFALLLWQKFSDLTFPTLAMYRPKVVNSNHHHYTRVSQSCGPCWGADSRVNETGRSSPGSPFMSFSECLTFMFFCFLFSLHHMTVWSTNKFSPWRWPQLLTQR